MSAFYRTSTCKRRPAAGWYTMVEWLNILHKQGQRCLDCRVRFSRRIPATVGHLRPVILGGTNWPENIIAQCGSCNSKQGASLHPSSEAA